MSQNGPAGEVWVLGATGRVGTAVAARLAAKGVVPVLVGRDRSRLVRAGATIEGDRETIVAGSPEQIAAEIRKRRPAVVINTVGEYADTAVSVARACMPGGHYVDLANDLVAVPRLLDLHDEAVASGSTLVTGAGFGVLATEAVVAKLCEGRPAPRRVHVDALASVALGDESMGAALAASMVDVLATGGRRYENDRLVKARLGADPQHIRLPDGQTVKSAGFPSGELHAARLASGAPSVTAAGAAVPTAPLVRAILPVLSALLSVPALRRLAVRQLARIRVKAAPRPRAHSWGHAVVQYPDGTCREGWLRADEGMDYTAGVTAEATARLARGEGRPGAYTPAAAFGSDLAADAGGVFILD